MKCNHKNCSTCPYDYCIAETVASENQKAIEAKQTSWRKDYNKTYYKINQKDLKERARRRGEVKRAAKKMERLNKCHWCSKEFDKPHEMIKYHKYYFCCEECLGEYLVNKAQHKEELEVIWVDTEENIEILAREEAAQW